MGATQSVGASALRAKLWASVLAASLLVAGCSDGDDNGADKAGDAPTTTGAPVKVLDERAFKVMVIGDETSSLDFTVAEAVPAVQGALAGLPNVEVLHCDSAGDPNANKACQRDAVEAGVAAVIGSFGEISQDTEVLVAAGIPVIGAADPGAPNSFALSAPLAVYASLGVAAGEAECTEVATLYLDGAEFLADMVQQGVEMSGAEEVARSGIPQNTPDIAPQVAALTSADADCIVLSVTPTQVIQAITALEQAGVEATLIAAGAVLTSEVVEELGELADGVITAEVQVNAGSEDPVVDQVAADIAANDPGAPTSTIAMLSWASAKLVEDALPSVQGEVTPATLTAALNSLVNAPAGGAIHPVTVKEMSNPLFKRVFNPWGRLYRISDGVPEPLSDDYFSLVEILNAAEMG